MSAIDIANHLVKDCLTTLPASIESVDDMRNAENLLSTLTNKYSYLLSMLMVLKIRVRESKSIDKNTYAEYVSKRDLVSDSVDMIKQQYNAISRMISTRQQILKEIDMY